MKQYFTHFENLKNNKTFLDMGLYNCKKYGIYDEMLTEDDKGCVTVIIIILLYLLVLLIQINM